MQVECRDRTENLPTPTSSERGQSEPRAPADQNRVIQAPHLCQEPPCRAKPKAFSFSEKSSLGIGGTCFCTAHMSWGGRKHPERMLWFWREAPVAAIWQAAPRVRAGPRTSRGQCQAAAASRLRCSPHRAEACPSVPATLFRLSASRGPRAPASSKGGPPAHLAVQSPRADLWGISRADTPCPPPLAAAALPYTGSRLQLLPLAAWHP